MSTTSHHIPSLHAPSGAGVLRATLVGLLLLACLVEVVAAQEALPPAAYQDAAVLASRIDDTHPAASTEVTAVRTRLAAPISLPTAGGTDGRISTELAGVNYRWWLTNGRAELGLGVGTLGYLLAPPDGRLDGPRPLTGASPTFTLGMRYRMSEHSHIYADASGVRGLGADPSMAQYNTKVGVEWKPAKSTLGFEQGALGIHFDSGYKLSLKARHGGLGLYLRSTF